MPNASLAAYQVDNVTQRIFAVHSHVYIQILCVVSSDFHLRQMKMKKSAACYQKKLFFLVYYLPIQMIRQFLSRTDHCLSPKNKNEMICALLSAVVMQTRKSKAAELVCLIHFFGIIIIIEELKGRHKIHKITTNRV